MTGNQFRAALLLILATGLLGFTAISNKSVRQFAAGLVLGPPARTSDLSGWGPLNKDLNDQILSAAEHLCGTEQLKNENLFDVNSHLADLRGIDLSKPHAFTSEIILPQTEAWETGSGTVPGYPAVVVDRSDDQVLYRLYYSVHDAPAGIALATSENLTGPYSKRSESHSFASDSRVLRAPRRPLTTSHFSSPSLVWDEDESLWRLYFHYYAHEVSRNLGHQKTTVASNPTLGTSEWIIHQDDSGAFISTHPTDPVWAASQSSYHIVARIGERVWIALMRGTNTKKNGQGIETPIETSIAIAVSSDGLRWSQWSSEPIEAQPIEAGVLQPFSIACTANRELSLLWYHRAKNDHGVGRLIAAPLADTKVRRHIFPGWELSETSASIFRRGRDLIVFHGNRMDSIGNISGAND